MSPRCSSLISNLLHLSQQGHRARTGQLSALREVYTRLADQGKLKSSLQKQVSIPVSIFRLCFRLLVCPAGCVYSDGITVFSSRFLPYLLSILDTFSAILFLELTGFPLAKHFDRDPETNQVLWFAAPPVDVARPRVAKHSLEYLHFIAKKRKRELANGVNGDGGDGEMDVDTANPQAKAPVVHPTVSEVMAKVAKEMLAAQKPSS